MDKHTGGRRRTSSSDVVNGDSRERIDHLRSIAHRPRARSDDGAFLPSVDAQRGSPSSNRRKSFDPCNV